MHCLQHAFWCTFNTYGRCQWYKCTTGVGYKCTTGVEILLFLSFCHLICKYGINLIISPRVCVKMILKSPLHCFTTRLNTFESLIFTFKVKIKWHDFSSMRWWLVSEVISGSRDTVNLMTSRNCHDYLSWTKYTNIINDESLRFPRSYFP